MPKQVLDSLLGTLGVALTVSLLTAAAPGEPTKTNNGGTVTTPSHAPSHTPANDRSSHPTSKVNRALPYDGNGGGGGGVGGVDNFPSPMPTRSPAPGPTTMPTPLGGGGGGIGGPYGPPSDMPAPVATGTPFTIIP